MAPEMMKSPRLRRLARTRGDTAPAEVPNLAANISWLRSDVAAAVVVAPAPAVWPAQAPAGQTMGSRPRASSTCWGRVLRDRLGSGALMTGAMIIKPPGPALAPSAAKMATTR